MKKTNRPSTEELDHPRFQEPLRPLTSDSNTANFLFVVRLRGSLLAWGLGAPVEGSHLRNALGWRPLVETSKLHPLYPVDQINKAIRAVWESGSPDLLSLEVYGNLTGSVEGNARPSRLGAAFWRGGFHRAFACSEETGTEQLIFKALLANTFQQPWVFFTDIPERSAKICIDPARAAGYAV